MLPFCQNNKASFIFLFCKIIQYLSQYYSNKIMQGLAVSFCKRSYTNIVGFAAYLDYFALLGSVTVLQKHSETIYK